MYKSRGNEEKDRCGENTMKILVSLTGGCLSSNIHNFQEFLKTSKIAVRSSVP